MKYVHIYDDSHFEEDRDYVGVGVWAMIIFSVCVVFYYFYEYTLIPKIRKIPSQTKVWEMLWFNSNLWIYEYLNTVLNNYLLKNKSCEHKIWIQKEIQLSFTSNTILIHRNFFAIIELNGKFAHKSIIWRMTAKCRWNKHTGLTF